MSELRIYPAAQWEQLADALADALAHEPADPWMSQRVVLARPGGFLARWLRDALATRLGVVANLRFESLEEALLERAGTQAEAGVFLGRGSDRIALLSCLPAPGSDPAFADIDAYLRDDRARGVASFRSVALAGELLRSLRRAEGRSPEDQTVWPPSHRVLLARLHALRGARSLPERLLAEPCVGAHVPALHVFGWPAASPLSARALFCSAKHAPVSLYLLTASPRRAARGPAHPLVAANDRIGITARASAEQAGARSFAPPSPSHLPAKTLLAQLQHDLATATDAPPLPRVRQLDPSLQIHGAHGARRQVEILHDVLLRAFEDDPTLHARDVRILTPDVAIYEPLLRAQLGGGTIEAGRAWPFVIAGGARGADTTPEAILHAVLGLADSRFTVAEVLALLAMAPVQARFGIATDELPRLEGWLDEAGVRWGRDGEHRARCLGMPADATVARQDEGTWAFGLERLALSITSPPETGLFAGRLPVQDLEGDDARLGGSFLAFVRALLRLTETCGTAADVDTWIDRAETVLRTLTAPLDPDDDEATDDPFADLRRELAALGKTPEHAGLRFDAAGFRALVSEGSLLAERTRGPRDGRLDASWIGPLEPDGALPARIVALLGIDDETFPRRDDTTEVAEPPGTRHPLESDARTDDRAAFLQAILAARDTLVIVAGLFDPRTNAPRPLAAPLAELVAQVETLVEPPLRHGCLRFHPLQPFAEASFLPDERGTPLGHDRGALAIAAARREPARPLTGPFEELLAEDRRLPEYTDTDIELSTLTGFFRDPVRALLRLRLRAGLHRDPVGRADRGPLELSGLAQARLRRRFLAEALRTPRPADEASVRALLRATGEVPIGGAGEALLDEFVRGFEALRATFGPRLDELRAAPRCGVEARLNLPEGPRTVRGVVAGLSGARLVRVDLSSPLRPARLLEAYLTLLTVGAASPEAQPNAAREAEILGLGDDGEAQRVVLVAPADPAASGATLERYMRVFLEGLTFPLRFGERSSFAFAHAVHAAGWTGPWADVDPAIAEAATRAASRVWSQRDAAGGDIGEGASPTAFSAFGGDPIYRSTTGGPGVDARFAQLAETIYGPVLRALRDDGAPRA